MALPPLNLAWTVVATFIRTIYTHFFHFQATVRQSVARGELSYDLAFNVFKALNDRMTYLTVEAAQPVSAPSTKASASFLSSTLLIPLPSCTTAAELLIRAFGGPEEARKVVGGVEWWDVRALDGVAAEWMVECATQADRREKESDGQPILLYLHGGAYYARSIDSHRFLVERLTSDIRGRAFAINYRKAPQFPFPCALQNALAAYLFLIRPPPNAGHEAIDPSQIVLAGDSAGGGLALALLQVLRDVGIQQPSGAALISPWCDLTHSFPSFMENAESDFLSPYGFIHQPSSLWPPPASISVGGAAPSPSVYDRLAQDSIFSQAEKKRHIRKPLPKSQADQDAVSPSEKGDIAITVDGISQIIRGQLQFYATNTQLTHPYDSPAFATFRGLCPLLFIAGDKERLRDEIIYTAHKASDPDRFPTPAHIVKATSPISKFQVKLAPPRTLLQVYDGMCHVPAAFKFTSPGHHCCNEIASFLRRTLADASVSDANGLSPYAGVCTQVGVPLADDMLRQRVDTRGRRRPLESPTDLPALQVPVEEIGKIKELIAKRWLVGQTLWSSKFARAIGRIERDRLRRSYDPVERQLWNWGAEGENPPPGALAGRTDVDAALNLARRHAARAV